MANPTQLGPITGVGVVRRSWGKNKEVEGVGGCVAALLDSAGLGGFAGVVRLTKSEQPVPNERRQRGE